MSAEPPVLPDAEEARRWAAEELAKPEYRQAAPGWLESFWEGILEWLRSLDASSADAGPLPSSLIGIAIAVVIAAGVMLARPRLNAKVRQAREVFGTDSSLLTAADYRQRAETAAAAAKWGDAVVDRFRALVRSAEDRTILNPQPGRTADEVARELALPFGAYAHRLNHAARTFDAVRYGNHPALQADYLGIAGLDAELESARPARPAVDRDPAALP